MNRLKLSSTVINFCQLNRVPCKTQNCACDNIQTLIYTHFSPEKSTFNSCFPSLFFYLRQYLFLWVKFIIFHKKFYFLFLSLALCALNAFPLQLGAIKTTKWKVIFRHHTCVQRKNITNLLLFFFFGCNGKFCFFANIKLQNFGWISFTEIIFDNLFSEVELWHFNVSYR